MPNRPYSTDIQDFPYKGMNRSLRPYMLGEGILSNTQGFIPSNKGGYERSKQWAAHYTLAGGGLTGSILGISTLGPLYFGGTSQCTFARLPSTGQATQHRILANGTVSGSWGGPAQLSDYQNDPAKVAYHKWQGFEFTLGWDALTGGTGKNMGCMLAYTTTDGINSCLYPVGIEPISQSGITLAEEVGDSLLPSSGLGFDYTYNGYVKVVLAYRGNSYAYMLGYGSTDPKDGPPDLSSLKTMRVTGSNKYMKITNVPAGEWPSTGYVLVYRTKVVATEAQLAIEPLYLEQVQAHNVGTVYCYRTGYGLSDTNLVKQPRLEPGKYKFPSAKENSKYQTNLGITNHFGRLMVWGVENPSRLWIAGYTDVDGVPVVDNNFWQYSVDLEGQDNIQTIVSFKGGLLCLGENGLYKLRDEDANPKNWWFEKMAEIHGANDHAMAVIADAVFIVARSLGGQWNVWVTDGYNFKVVGDPVSTQLSSTTGVVNIDGMPVLVGDTTAERYAMAIDGRWGRLNVTTGLKWTLGRNSSWQSGAPMIATTGGVYYEGSTFSNDSSDYVETRDHFHDFKGRTQSLKLHVYCSKLSTNATLKAQQKIENGSYTAMNSDTAVTIDQTEGQKVEIGAVQGLQQARRTRFKIIASNDQQLYLEGHSLQMRVPEKNS